MEILVGLHNILRWVIVVLAVLALVRSFRGWFKDLAYSEQDRKIGVYFGAAMDTQLLLGVILWIFGSWGLRAFDMASGLEGANRMAVLYFAIEHAFAMLVAVILVHVGTITAKRAASPKTKHQRQAVFFTIAALLIVVAIPWTQRPLFPGL
jgi:hypothetical protein